MSIIIPANTLAAGDSLVTNSVRLDGASSFMTKTMGTPTNTKKYTMSVWFKRSKLDAQQSIFRSTNGNASNDSHLTFNSNNTLRWQEYGGSAQISSLVTNQLFRDTSAWSHVVVVYDSAQSTASNRAKMYVNGTEVTSFGTQTQPSHNADSFFNKDGEVLSLGRTQYDGGGNYFSGYVAEVVMCDGQALAADQFGEFDEDSEIWKPIDVSGLTFGTNGFYLDFEASGNLGNDANGGTDFGETGLTAVDQTTDTCENNFATANPLNVNAGAVGTFAFGNTTVKVANSSGRVFGSSSTLGMTTGKWYCEAKIITVDSTLAGVSANASEDARDNAFPGYQDHSVGILFDSGNKYISDSGTTHGDAFSANDILMIALDLDNNNVYFGHNGNWFDGSGNADESSPNSAIAVTAAASTADGAYFFTFGDGGGSAKGKVSWNFGNASHAITSGNGDGDGFGNFEFTVPSGYFALCTKNLAEYG